MREVISAPAAQAQSAQPPALEAENQQLRDELVRQWLSAHSDRCGCHEGDPIPCDWPRPAILDATDAAAAVTRR